MKTTATLLALVMTTLSLHAQEIPYANTIAITPTDDSLTIVAKAAHVVPTLQQKAAMDREFIGFIHFGPNTFSRREWGTGQENPADFTLADFNTDQWVKSMKDAGMKMIIFTAKHHDGFVLWQSRYTTHGIMSSPTRGGNADIVKSLAESCRKYGMDLGVYLSPADLYQIENPEGLYGNLSPKTTRTIPRQVEGRPFADTRTFTFEGIDDYNEYFLNQLFELLTEYGSIKEVWFDGAHPKRKGGQTYNNAAWMKLIRTLAPEAVIFGRTDVRWCGNEAGDTRPTEWNVIPFTANPDTMSTFPDLMDADLGSRAKLMKANWLHYQQPEVNTSIREGWFYRDDDKQRTRSADDVFDIYERAVGGNGTFLLNVPPNREGLISQTDVEVLREVGRRIINTYTYSLLPAQGVLTDGCDSTFIEVTTPPVLAFDKPTQVNRVMLAEPVSQRGERIERHAIDVFTDGQWQQVAEATNVGRKRIVRFATTTADSLRIRVIESRLTPLLCEVGAYYYQAGAPDLTITQRHDGTTVITPRPDVFGWNRAQGTDIASALMQGLEIRYTTDGSEPQLTSPLYTKPLTFSTPSRVRAAAWLDGKRGAVTTEQTGYPRTDIRCPYAATAIFDGDVSTSAPIAAEGLVITMPKRSQLSGFAYLPPQGTQEGLIDRGEIFTSTNGHKWRSAGIFEFGNLINDPSRRFHHFAKPVSATYVKIVPLSTAAGKGLPTAAELMLF